MHLRFNRFLLWAAPAAWLGCGGGGTDVVLPSLSVSTSTSGVELDPDGYSVVVDGGQGQSIGINATIMVDGLGNGAHSVELSGVAQNCAAQGDNPRTVTVASGSTATLAFAITCNASAGDIQVTTATTGSGTDPDGFGLLLDGTDRGAIGVSATTSLGGVLAGSHLLGLTGLAANCQVVGDNPRPVTVIAGQTVPVPFSVTCTAPGPTAGTLLITTSTTGANPDADGYTVAVDGRAGQPIGPAATLKLDNLSASAHRVQLGGVAANCTASPSSPVQVTVPAGGTATVGFTITCATIAQPFNLRIAGLYLTQSTQTMSGSVPLVQNRRTFLRVFVVADGANSARPVVRVRFSREGTTVRELTIAAPSSSTPTQVDEGTLRSSWNQPIDAALIQPNTSILAEVDPDRQVTETNENDNVFPASGSPQAISVQAVAPARILFIPLLQPGQAQPGNVSSANKDQLVTLAGKLYPLNGVETEVHQPFQIGALQGDGTGWNQALTDLLGLRDAEGSDRTYFGVAKLDYSSGINGRGVVGEPVAIGTDAPADVVRVTAHELGHTWNEMHTPCGNPPDLDPGYPYGTGIGVYGFDLSAGALEAPATPNIMSYCSSPWISDYTYKRVLAFRATSAISSQASVRARQPALLVRGYILNGQPVLEPAFQVTTRPRLPAAPGPYSVEATALDGSRIFALSFDARPVADDGQDSRHFAFAVPLDPAQAAQVANLRLFGPGARVAGLSQSVARVGPRAVSDSVVARREPGGRVTLQWNAAVHPMIMVRDPDTGEVLAFVRGGDAKVTTRKGALDLDLSDGVRSQRVRRAISLP